MKLSSKAKTENTGTDAKKASVVPEEGTQADKKRYGNKEPEDSLSEIVFILDRSGSMSDMVEDTVGGFNSMLKKQKRLEGRALVSTVLFSGESVILHDRLPIGEIKPLTQEQYTVGGCTALYDAIVNTVQHIGNIHKYARAQDVPDKTVFVITTDGMENASREFNLQDVRTLITNKQEEYGWEFIFVAANIDATKTAHSMGIRRENAAEYCATPIGTRCLYESVDCAVASVRSSGKVGKAWKDKL